jgi:hypothetical protein
LLAGDWLRAFKAARENVSGGFLSGDDERLLVLPAIMAWLAGWPEQPLPLHLGTLLEAGFGHLDVPENPESSNSHRFRTALSEAMGAWQKTAKVRKVTLLDPFIGLVLKGLKAILAKGSPTAATQAALWAVATAEVIQRQRSATAASTFLDDLASQRQWGGRFPQGTGEAPLQTGAERCLGSTPGTLIQPVLEFARLAVQCCSRGIEFLN